MDGLAKFYGSPYFLNRDDDVRGYWDYVGDRKLHVRNAFSLLRVIERVCDGAERRLLDVGCAHGFFLDTARRRGWTVAGVDISPEAVDFARERLRLDVYQGTLEEASLKPESFDVVCMNGSIEHLRDPMSAVRTAVRLLRDSGLMVVTTIAIEGLLGFYSWKPPEHLFYFSFRTLSRLLEEAGLSVESKATSWAHFRVADVVARLWTYWGLPHQGRIVKALEATGMHRGWVKIPTNEIRVIARKR
jgi:2-polyprenyl-3-methyl-5-hydroxy-6-metoxy-1,4-benzoquinol methylase